MCTDFLGKIILKTRCAPAAGWCAPSLKTVCKTVAEQCYKAHYFDKSLNLQLHSYIEYEKHYTCQEKIKLQQLIIFLLIAFFLYTVLYINMHIMDIAYRLT